MRFDFHVHSCFSKDSEASLESILDHARKNGLDGIAVCDHDTIEGGLACARKAKDLGSDILVIPGIEVMSSKGHILVLGVEEGIESHLTPQETIKRARDMNGVVIIPHPFKLTSHGIGFVEGLDIDAVETLNSRCVTNVANKKARIAVRALGLPEVGGSDAHISRMVGRAYTEVDATEKTVESVLDAIRQGRVSARGKITPKSVVIRQMIYGNWKKIERFFSRS